MLIKIEVSNANTFTNCFNKDYFMNKLIYSYFFIFILAGCNSQCSCYREFHTIYKEKNKTSFKSRTIKVNDLRNDKSLMYAQGLVIKSEFVPFTWHSMSFAEENAVVTVEITHYGGDVAPCCARIYYYDYGEYKKIPVGEEIELYFDQSGEVVQWDNGNRWPNVDSAKFDDPFKGMNDELKKAIEDADETKLKL